MLSSATMGQRAWFAWKCLPRDERGDPPSWRELEEKHGLSNGSIYKLTWDLTTRPSFEQLEKIAAALGTTPGWLQAGKGDGPRARWPVENRPAAPTKKLRAPHRPSLSVGLEKSLIDEAKKLPKRRRPVLGSARK
jgi:hypothetical protein